MAEKLKTLVKRRPVMAFYLLAFTLTWLGWIPQAAHSHGLFPFDSPIFYFLGGIGPILSAYLVLRVLQGQDAWGEMFRPFSYWREGVFWYIAAFTVYPAVWLGALVLRGEAGVEIAKLGSLPGLLPVFALAFFSAIPEEVAWRGFALPRLQTRFSALTASLIAGVLWALWHLPLLFNQGSVMSTYPLVPYLLKVIAFSVVYTWLFNSTRGSLLFVTIFHAASNTVGPFTGTEQMALAVLLAAILVAACGAAHLSRRGARVSQGWSAYRLKPTENV
jgi:uncharacterized protein